MPEILSEYASELISKVGRDGVRRGEEECVYHLSSADWKPIELLPPDLKRAVEIGQSTLDPAPRWEPEGFSHNPEALITWLQVTFVAQKTPPFDFGFFKPPSPREEEWFYQEFKPQVKELKEITKPVQKYYRYLKEPPTRIHVPAIRTVPDFTPTPEVPIEPIVTDFLLRKFEFWRTGDYQSKTGADLHRAVMVIAGFPLELIEAFNEMIQPILKADFRKFGHKTLRNVFENNHWQLKEVED